MVPLQTVFVILLGIFALIGSLRGWAKEIIVASSVLLALFIEQVLTVMVPPIRDLWAAMPVMSRFWIRIIVFAVIVLFGYASPSLAARFGAKVARERLQDIMLGFFLGFLNGLLIVGAIWFYLDEGYYGVPEDQRTVRQEVLEDGQTTVTIVEYAGDAAGIGGIRPPQPGTAAANLLPYLPPRIIKGPPLFLAVGVAFVFVIIVFI